MTARTPAQAASRFLEITQRAISCVSRSVPDIAGGYFPSASPHILTLNNNAPVTLAGVSQLHLTVMMGYTIVATGDTSGRWQVVLDGYAYGILDSTQRELLAFHWHPRSRSAVTYPHLHIGAGAQIGYERLHRAHVPTGQVSLNDVLRFAITDLGVEPLIDRDAALRILSER